MFLFREFGWKCLFTTEKLWAWGGFTRKWEDISTKPQENTSLRESTPSEPSFAKTRRRVLPVGESPKRGINIKYIKISYISPIGTEAPPMDGCAPKYLDNVVYIPNTAKARFVWPKRLAKSQLDHPDKFNNYLDICQKLHKIGTLYGHMWSVERDIVGEFS